MILPANHQTGEFKPALFLAINLYIMILTGKDTKDFHGGRKE